MRTSHIRLESTSILITVMCSAVFFHVRAQEPMIQTTCPIQNASQPPPLELGQEIQRTLVRTRTCIAEGDRRCAERGINELDEAAVTADEHAAVLISRGTYRQSRNQSRQAIAAFEEVLDNADTNPALIDIAAMQAVASMMQSGRTGRATETLERHFSCVFWTPDGLRLAADVHFADRNYEAALQYAESSIALHVHARVPAHGTSTTEGSTVRNSISLEPMVPRQLGLVWIESAREVGLDPGTQAVHIARALADTHPDLPFIPLYKQAPVYPQRALGSLTSGDVTFAGRVGVDGRVHDPYVLESSHEMFEQAALDSARQFIYVPRLEAGVVVESPFTNKITFEINR